MTFEERMEAIDRRLERLFREIGLRFQDTRDTIEGLARIAGVHQERRDNLGE